LKSKKYLIIIGILISIWLLIKYSVKEAIISNALSSTDSTSTSIQLVDDYKIYSLIINDYLISKETELILIQNQTGIGFLDSPPEEPPFYDIEKDLWSQYKTQNANSLALIDSFILNTPYRLINSSEIKNTNRILNIFDVYSTPFLQFSRIGYNTRSSEALLHISMFFSLNDEFLGTSTFAAGEYFLLKKIEGVWTLIKQWESFIT